MFSAHDQQQLYEDLSLKVDPLRSTMSWVVVTAPVRLTFGTSAARGGAAQLAAEQWCDRADAIDKGTRAGEVRRNRRKLGQIGR